MINKIFHLNYKQIRLPKYEHQIFDFNEIDKYEKSGYIMNLIGSKIYYNEQNLKNTILLEKLL